VLEHLWLQKSQQQAIGGLRQRLHTVTLSYREVAAISAAFWVTMRQYVSRCDRAAHLNAHQAIHVQDAEPYYIGVLDNAPSLHKLLSVDPIAGAVRRAAAGHFARPHRSSSFALSVLHTESYALIPSELLTVVCEHFRVALPLSLGKCLHQGWADRSSYAAASVLQE
jgi:hypothetical protein